MQRTASTSIDLDLSGPAQLIFSVAVAQGQPISSETLTISVDGEQVQPTEIIDAHGTRLHSVRVDGASATLRYQVAVDGIAAEPPVADIDPIAYLRPSRYCESDTLGPTAAAEFAGLESMPLLRAVITWVNEKLTYVAGSSRPTDGAVRTLLSREGVCRDFAHLAVALLRSLNVPARVAAVYAPGLSPMEFHAVAEALVGGRWWVVDATELAPRQSLLRVATGRDAADTAFLTASGAATTLTRLEVTAVVDDFHTDDTDALTQLR
ncbi:MAG: transglutaminase family protein [Microlunatus sp.]